MKKRTDTERLDALQECAIGFGNGWIIRVSTTGRGLRMHETRQPGAETDIRKAIDKYLDKPAYNGKH